VFFDMPGRPVPTLSATGPGRLERWIGWMARARLAVLTAALALTAASLYLAATGLRIDTDTAKMIAEDAPYKRDLIAFKLAFPQLDDDLVLVLDGKVEEEVEAAADALAAALRKLPGFAEVWAPGGEAFFRRNGLLYLDRESLAALSDRLSASAPLLAALAADPSLRGLFGVLGLALRHVEDGAVPQDSLARLIDQVAAVAEAAGEGRPGLLPWRQTLRLQAPPSGPVYRVIVAQPRLDFSALSPAAMAIAAVRREAAALGIDGTSVRLRLTGEVALEYEELKSAESSGKASGALSLLLVLVLLGFGLRSTGLTLATLATLIAGLIWTAGLATLTVGTLNLISVAFAVLFVGLGVDFSIHFCLRYREEVEAGTAGNEAIAGAARGTGRGLTIAAAGAGIGFYAFLPTEYRGFAELGLISGSSMFIALAATFTLLPALIASLPAGPGGALPRRDPWLWVDRFVARRHRAVLGLSALVGLAGLALLPWLEFDFDPLNLKSPASESFATLKALAAEPRNAVNAAEVLSPNLETALRTAAALAALPEVEATRTLDSFVPSDQAAKLELVAGMADVLAPALEAKPTAPPSDAERVAAVDGLLSVLVRPRGEAPLRRATARLATALEPVATNAPALAGLERRLMDRLPSLFERLRANLAAKPVAIESLPDELRRHWVAADGRHRVQVLPATELAGNRGTRRFVAAVLAVAPHATGVPVITSRAGDVVTASFAQATILAASAIALLLLALYRRPTLLCLTLGPLALAAVLTLATSVLIGMPLNFANVIVLPLLFGLGIASAVHLVERQRQLRPGQELMATTTPRAVLFSTLTTLASFGSLTLSEHRGMASMGVLLTIAIAHTLLCTLIVLPSLMPLLLRGFARKAG
jgi:hypothetical protein